MKRTLTALIAVAALMATGCTKDDTGNKSTGSATHTEDFNVNYTIKQSRSAKRGLCGSMSLPQFDIPTLADGVGWYYNWSSNCPSTTVLALLPQYDMTFFPMAWNNNYNAGGIRAYKQAQPEAEFLLAYNEPNLTDQANMTPSQAAEKWGDLVALAKETGMKLISPALNYGTLANYSDPVKWLDEFLACDGVSLDDMYGIALHCYMPTVEALRSYIHRFEKYNKPIFLTEFCHANNSITNNATTQHNYMCETVNYLEAEPMVEGYSWFMDRASGDWGAISVLNSNANNPALTDLGLAYVYASSYDTDHYYGVREAIPAEHYCNNSLAQSVADGAATLAAAPHVGPSTDSTGILELRDFYTVGSWVEYNVSLDESRTYALALRYNSPLRDSTFEISIDGTVVGEVTLPVGEGWKTHWLEGLDLTAGRHTLRVTLTLGRANFNWFYFD